ncbi:MAG: T9SS C-terminal target domain-containing protein [Ignavibacteriae bacterium]|nr:MAG: T9SS C-terminal target domain-containing protein [Ignavibacteriota bacterium]
MCFSDVRYEMNKIGISILMIFTVNLQAQVNGTTGLPLGGLGSGAIKYNAGSGTFSANFRSPTRNGDYQPLTAAQFQIFTKRGNTIVASQKLAAEQKAGSVNDDAIFPAHMVHFGDINGLTVDMTGYIPFDPRSVDMMTHPCALYEFTVRNNQSDSVQAAVAFQMRTDAGPTAIPDSGFSSSSSSLQLAMIGVINNNPNGTVTYGNDSGFFSTGLCNNNLAGTTNRLSLRVSLNPGESKTLRFVLAWYKSDNLDHYRYSVLWGSAHDAAVSALKNFDSFANTDNELVRRMRASNLPPWLQDQTLNSLVNLVNNSVFLKDGRYCHTEGMWTPEGTMDQMWHARQIYTMINPDLAWRELEWWARTQHVSSFPGQIHHDVGENFNYVAWDATEHTDYRAIDEWVDLNCGFIISLYEAFIATGDQTRLFSFWPYAVKAGDRILEQVGLYGSSEYPYTFSTSLSSYDAGGNSQAYNSGLSVVTYRILNELAGVMGDHQTAATFNDAFQKARIGFENRYLSASFPSGQYCESALGGPWIANFLKMDSCWTAKKINSLFSTISNYYDPLNKGMGYTGGSYSEWSPYLVSHLAGYALQTNRITIWSSLQKDMYDRNYLNRNLVFNQQLGIPPRSTTPIWTATSTQGTNQYISIPVLWRNYYDIVGFHQNKYSGEMWLEPKLIDTSTHQLQNALIITPDGYAVMNYNATGDSYQNQQIVFMPDRSMNVSALYVWDLYADTASAVTSLTVNGTNTSYSRMGTGGQSHIKINWSGTIPASGLTILIEGKAKSAAQVLAAPKNIRSSAVNPSMVQLTWNAAPGDVSGYIVEIKKSGSFQQLARLNSTDTSYTDTGLLASTEYTYRVKAFDAQNISGPSADVIISTPRSNNGTSLIAVNAGGSAFQSAGGIQFTGDAASGFVSGGQTYSTTAAIDHTQDDALYQTERYGNFSYSIPLPNDQYNVVLKFSEIYQDNPGARVFSVTMEGNEVIHNLDLYFRSGKYSAYDVVVPVDLRDGSINISFLSVVDNAKLSALEIFRRNPAAVQDEKSGARPVEFSLHQNYPNPFNPSTTIEYSVKDESFVSLRIYDVLGREVKTLVQEVEPAGRHAVRFDATGLNSGMYLCRIAAGQFHQTRKMLLLR